MSVSGTPEISIVVANWNGEAFLQEGGDGGRRDLGVGAFIPGDLEFGQRGFGLVPFVGDDGDGRFLLDECDRYGIERPRLAVAPEGQTASQARQSKHSDI